MSLPRTECSHQTVFQQRWCRRGAGRAVPTSGSPHPDLPSPDTEPEDPDLPHTPDPDLPHEKDPDLPKGEDPDLPHEHDPDLPGTPAPDLPGREPPMTRWQAGFSI